MSEDRISSPEPIKRVAELANRLAEAVPDARRVVSELFDAFQAVHLHYRRPQPIAKAPREPGLTLQLFCPIQGGWHYGEWCPEGGSRWVAAIDKTVELVPEFWLPPAPVPTTYDKGMTCEFVRITGSRVHTLDSPCN
jgi:hypothetical protein